MGLRSHHRNLALLSFALWLALLAPAAVAAQSGPSAADQALLALLEEGSPVEQEQAAQQLAAAPSAAFIPDLTRIFRAADNPRPAASVLAAMGTPGAWAVLVSGLGDEALTARRSAAQRVLLEKGDEAVPALTVGLQNSSPVTRRYTAQVLGFIGSARPVNSLLRVAQSDAEARVRQEAVWALGEIGEPRVRSSLKAIAHGDPDAEVRIEAENAVLRVGDESRR